MLNRILERFAQEELVLSWNDVQRQAIKTSIQTLADRARGFFRDSGLIDINVFGSWSRNTILPRKYDPQSDIDIMFAFDRANHCQMNSESVRAKVKRFADYYYSSSEVHLDAPCVKLEMGHIKFDLVPAIPRQWIGGYEIPNGAGGWMDTDPDQLDDKLVTMNKLMDGNVVRRVVRLCKYWNKAKEHSALTSYQLENFVLDNINYTPVTWGRSRSTYDCFLHVLELICYQWVYSRSTTSSILATIKDARRDGDYDKQLTWIQHLLPQLVV